MFWPVNISSAESKTGKAFGAEHKMSRESSTRRTLRGSSPYEGAAERMDAVSRSCARKLRRALSNPSIVAITKIGSLAREEVVQQSGTLLVGVPVEM